MSRKEKFVAKKKTRGKLPKLAENVFSVIIHYRLPARNKLSSSSVALNGLKTRGLVSLID